MGLTVKRMVTLASWAPRLMIEASAAGSTLEKMMTHIVGLADLSNDPALVVLAKSVQEMVADLELGRDEDAEVTPKEAIARIAAGEITPEQQRLFDRETQQSGL